MDLTIYHNPRCSKSRKTLELILAANINPTIKEYLNETLSAEEINILLSQLNLPIRDILRKGEAIYKTHGLSDKNLTDAELIDAVIESPILLERPIVSNGSQAIIGRPPENVNSLI